MTYIDTESDIEKLRSLLSSYHSCIDILQDHHRESPRQFLEEMLGLMRTDAEKVTAKIFYLEEQKKLLYK